MQHFLIKSLELSFELFWSKSKEKGTATKAIGDSFQQNYVKKMTILFLHWKNRIRITFTFKNEHPQKNSVFNPMRIQFLKNFGFALNSSLPKKTQSLRFRHGCQKDGKPTENMKNVKDKGTNDTSKETTPEQVLLEIPAVELLSGSHAIPGSQRQCSSYDQTSPPSHRVSDESF